MTLTPAQRRVLKALAEPGAVAHYMPYRGSFNPTAYWFLSTNNSRIRVQTMRILIENRLLKPTHDNIGYFVSATITDAGRAAVEATND